MLSQLLVTKKQCNNNNNCRITKTVIQGAPWSWKVMENDDNVMEFLLLH